MMHGVFLSLSWGHFKDLQNKAHGQKHKPCDFYFDYVHDYYKNH